MYGDLILMKKEKNMNGWNILNWYSLIFLKILEDKVIGCWNILYWENKEYKDNVVM